MWKDSETELDFLDFDYLKGILKSIISNEALLPASIGVYGDWGSGKSSLIKMSMDELKDEETVCLIFNGWLFESYEDAKIALMGSILDTIEAETVLGYKAKQCIKGLYKSIDKFKLLKSGVKFGADMFLTGGSGTLINMGLQNTLNSAGISTKKVIDGIDLEKIQENIQNELSNKEIRSSINEFQKNFKNLLAETKIDKLVVFIDELDRCSPDTILETLEAIRLFLFTGNVAFIIGADERHIAYAIKRKFQNIEGLQIDIGKEYLEKIIQYPIKIPRLNPKEVEFYITCLLLQKDLNEDEFNEIMGYLDSKKQEDFLNFELDYVLISDELPDIANKVRDSLIVAKQLSVVLANGLNGNPRQCKRFLNSLYMRIEMAKYKRIELNRKVLAKLMLLEYFKENVFRKIAQLSTTNSNYKRYLKELECEKISDDNELKLWEDDSWIKGWCKIEPKLSDIDLIPYFYFTRSSLDAKFDLKIENLSPRAQKVLDRLLNKTDIGIKDALKDQSDISEFECNKILENIFLTMMQDSNIDSKYFKAFINWGVSKQTMVSDLISYLSSIKGEQLKLSLIPFIELVWEKAIDKEILNEILERWKKENSKLITAINGIGKGV